MRNFFRNLVAAVGLFLAGIAAVNLVPLAFAQFVSTTNPRQPFPRYFQAQQTTYVRALFTVSAGGITGCNTNNCVVKIATASLPYNSAVVRVTVSVTTAFNGVTTDVLAVGTTLANANEIASSCNVHAVGVVACTMGTNPGLATGATTAQSGTNGGFDLFVKYTNTGGVATAGAATVIVEFAPPNDSTCVPAVPPGTTAAAC
jgi:hypothetical protein